MCDDEKKERRILAAQKRIEIRIGRPLFRDERKRVSAMLEERDPYELEWVTAPLVDRRPPTFD